MILSLAALWLLQDSSSSAWQHLAEQYDQNQDGVITREEYPRNDEHWGRLDSNQDGKLTPQEVGAIGKDRRKGRRGGGGRSGGTIPGRGAVAPRVGETAPDFHLPYLVREPQLRFEIEGLEPFVATVDTAKALAENSGLQFSLDERFRKEFRAFTRKGVGKTLRVLHGDTLLTSAELKSELPGMGVLTQAGGYSAAELSLLVGQLTGAPLRLSDFREEKPVALIFGSYT